VRERPQSYALTAIAYQRRRVFQRTLVAELLIETLFRYRDGSRFLLHGFVAMPDHVHILLSPSPDLAVERCVQLIKGGFSFAVRKEFAGDVWQDGYHAHRVVDDNDYENQLAYIANNPVRKGLGAYPHVHTDMRHAGRLDKRLW
jgi:putative transposase